MKIKKRIAASLTLIRLRGRSAGLRKIAGTVSASALMLGASSAATVGFNFQANYCYASAYSGAVVTGTAFGIGPNNWEGLSPMATGYGCPAAYFTLSQTIDTTSSGGGLNPLPAGSVTVTWSAYTANVSGMFGGYELPPPHYSVSPRDGFFNVYQYRQPGNEEVYWGFLRDGVNFGPGSVGGDNNQPGYRIDITGLKSLFPKTPFVVELIASSDSMQYLANASIIDVNNQDVQTVSYPNTPPVENVGDTPWVRGIGGGLSTGTGPINANHLKIVGNRASHGSNGSFSFNFASTISGFIVTDQPVISMSPQSVSAFATDQVTLRAYAVGVPALSYQWYKNGNLINGATDASYSFRAGTRDSGSYVLVVKNRFGTATSNASVVTISPSPGPGYKSAKVLSNPYLM